MFPVLVVVLLLASLSAAGQTIYKCTVGGKVAYGDRPCAAGVAAELAVPAAPAPDREAPRLLAQQKALLARLQKERRGREAVEERAQARAARAAAVTERRCARLRLQQRWLEEDVHKVMSEQRTAARHKAQRQRQRMALECPG